MYLRIAAQPIATHHPIFQPGQQQHDQPPTLSLIFLHFCDKFAVILPQYHSKYPKFKSQAATFSKHKFKNVAAILPHELIMEKAP
jgi:hypothetical protein